MRVNLKISYAWNSGIFRVHLITFIEYVENYSAVRNGLIINCRETNAFISR